VSLMVSVTAISSAAWAYKTDSSLRLLQRLREAPPDNMTQPTSMPSAAQAENAVVTIKFDHVLTAGEIAEYERIGLSFFYLDGVIARTKSIYPARIPWPLVDQVSGRAEVLRMEGSWRPGVFATLDVSAHEIEADSAWSREDALGFPLTGKGMRVADFDTGIDVFHPSFFYADGDTVDWLDLDQNTIFNPGSDAVDLDGNGQFSPGETLRFLDGWIYDAAHVWGPDDTSNDDNLYQTYWDWLYADQNNNGSRDFGPGSGYSESDPTYGERLFIALDDNDNGVLNLGERLVALGTSKIFATMNGGSVERVRGVDLIDSDDDTNGHGTAVSGILAGGTVGRHLFTGIAPDAEILAGYFFSGVPISYLIPWARSRDADAMLYEFGGFLYRFLDGSSLDEELVTTEHSAIVQVTPSGNLGRGGKHAVATVTANDSITLEIVAPFYGGNIHVIWGTTLWRTSMSDLTFRLRSPLGTEVTLDETVWYVDNYYLWYDYDTSSRGTHKMDLYIDRNTNPDVEGTWWLKVINTSLSDLEIISNVADEVSSWAGGTEFNNFVSDDKNVTFPATSDSALVNGSYSTRGFEGYDGVGGGSIPIGEISKFSGRGKRIDGLSLLDICSPGNYDVYSTRSHSDPAGYPLGSYRQFSGTSAAGPHVAAAAGIVQQAAPNATVGQVEYLLTSGAATDAFTGAVYNDTWGYGKLRILGALGVATAVMEMADGKRMPHLHLDQNYPNPFNPTTWIPFYLPRDGHTSITVYNVNGQLVKVLRNRWYKKGVYSIHWDGTDRAGHHVASGLYFCVLRQGGEKETRKMVLVR
ncbi:MAG: S8 family peptidase, partial [Candidatus Latescibacterota bacterium]